MALLIAAGVLTWSSWPRDPIVHTSVEDALRDYRARAGGEASLGGGFPRPGVYVYSIAGGETLAASIFDGAHPYEGEVTVTIEPSPCGVTELWRPLDTRWTKSSFCERQGELHLTRLTERHEFFGRPQLGSYRCRGAVPALAGYRVGSSWRIDCSGDSGSLRISSRVVATGAVEVDGRRLAAVRIRSRAVAGGDSSGVSVQSDWRRRSDGLLLRRSIRTEASVDVLGGGSYGENYSLELLATAPRR